MAPILNPAAEDIGIGTRRTKSSGPSVNSREPVSDQVTKGKVSKAAKMQLTEKSWLRRAEISRHLSWDKTKTHYLTSNRSKRQDPNLWV